MRRREQGDPANSPELVVRPQNQRLADLVVVAPPGAGQ